MTVQILRINQLVPARIRTDIQVRAPRLHNQLVPARIRTDIQVRAPRLHQQDE
jgi:hypothetical protein